MFYANLRASNAMHERASNQRNRTISLRPHARAFGFKTISVRSPENRTMHASACVRAIRFWIDYTNICNASERGSNMAVESRMREQRQFRYARMRGQSVSRQFRYAQETDQCKTNCDARKSTTYKRRQTNIGETLA